MSSGQGEGDTQNQGATTRTRTRRRSSPISSTSANGRALTKAGPPAIHASEPTVLTPATVAAEHIRQPPAISPPAPKNVAPAKPRPVTKDTVPALADPLLMLAADVLDDLERVRIANENRLRQLTRSTEDADGEERGFGLTLDHPDVARLAALVDQLAAAEHAAELNLKRHMRAHQLGPWVEKAKGVGEKQAARLLATIGDPYWNDLHGRPRTVSELWAYSGYHVILLDQVPGDTQDSNVNGHAQIDAQMSHVGQDDNATQSRVAASQTECDPQSRPAGHRSSDTQTMPAGHCLGDTPTTTAGMTTSGQARIDAQSQNAGPIGVAASRARGQKMNWSPDAKMRAHLVAVSIVKSGGPYREVYDKAREKYEDAIHRLDCKRCGPAGKPAQVGSPISAGHQHARAVRIVAKEVLKDLWRESKRIHELQ